MKKHYFMLLGAALLGFSANAQVSIGDVTYTTLSEAVSAASAGDVVTINENIEVSSAIKPNAAITIKGANPEITVTRTNAGTQVFQATSGNRGFIIQDLTIDANNASSAKCIIESNNGQLTVSNVTIKGVNQTSERAVIVQKGGGWVVLENLAIINPTLSDGLYGIFTGNPNGVTVKGTGTYSVYPEKTNAFKAENFTGKINIHLDTWSERIIVNGGNMANFELIDPAQYYSLIQNGDNLSLQYEKPVVKNITTDTEYTSLSAAINAAASNDVLSVLESCDATDRILCGNRNLTIEGAADGVVIKRTNTTSTHLMFEINNNYTLTLKNITVDANNIKNDKPVFNIKGNLTLENVVIKNAGQSASLITLSTTGRRLNLTNTTIEECGEINSANTADNCTITLNSDTNISFNLSNGSKLAVAEDGELTNTEAINIIPVDTYTYTDGAVIVENCTDASKFNFENTENWVLAAKDGNLVLANTTGIEGIVADDNAPVEYFNLQGVRVANPENGLYIRRQGSKVQKVLVK